MSLLVKFTGQIYESCLQIECTSEVFSSSLQAEFAGRDYVFNLIGHDYWSCFTVQICGSSFQAELTGGVYELSFMIVFTG